MAILPTLPGIEAVILINGNPALEYVDDNEVRVEHEDEDIAEYQATHTISKYIQSQTDQKFSIQLKVGSPYVQGQFMAHVRLNFHIYVDGAKVADPWCSRLHFKHSPVGTKWIREVKGVVGKSGRKVKPFIFADITTNSNDVAKAEVERLKETMKKVGVIEIRVNSATAGRTGDHGDYSEKDLALQDANEVPENALKGDAKTHGTILGKALRADSTKNLDNRDNAPDYPEVIFRFLYRDKESLRQLHVIERTPSQSTSSSRSVSPEGDHSESPAPYHSASPEAEAGPSLGELTELLERSAQLLARAKDDAARRASSVASGANRAARGKGKESKKKKAVDIKRERGVKVKRERSEEQSNQGRTAKKRRRIDPVTIIISSDDDDDDENEGANNPNAGHLEEVRLLKRVDQLKAVAMVVGMRL